MGFFKSVRNFFSNPITRVVSTAASGLAGAGALDGLGKTGQVLTDVAGAANAASGIASIANPELPGWSRALGAAQVGMGGYNLLQNRDVGGFGNFGSPGLFGEGAQTPSAALTAGTQRPTQSLNSAFGMSQPGSTGAPSTTSTGRMLADGSMPATGMLAGNPTGAGLNLGGGSSGSGGSPWAFIDDSTSRGGNGGLGISDLGALGQGVVNAASETTRTATEKQGLFGRVFGNIADRAAENPLGALGQGLGLIGVAGSLFAPDPAEQMMSDYDARFNAMSEPFDPNSQFAQNFMSDYQDRRTRDLSADYDQALSELRSQFATRGMLDSSVFVLAQDELLQSRMELESNISQEAYDAYLDYTLRRQQGIVNAGQLAAVPTEIGMNARSLETNFGPFAQVLANYD